jgi:hypothetical protein
VGGECEDQGQGEEGDDAQGGDGEGFHCWAVGLGG